MKIPYFTIVIPVYNVQEYIEQCLNSVLIQTFKDLEVIVVNDGSPDLSLEICENFQSIDSRVRVFSKKNGGLSSARNFGIGQALGEYLIFLDSDDYWDDNEALLKIFKRLEKGKDEILIFGCKDFDVRTNILKISKGGYNAHFVDTLNKKEIIDYLIENSMFPGAAWLLAVKRNFIVNNAIFFNEDNNAEDIDWLLNVFVNTKKITVLDEPFYIYRKNRKTSITSSFGEKSLRGILYAIERWKSVLIQDSINHSMLKILSYNYILAVAQFRSNPILLKYQDQLEDNKDLLKPDLALNIQTKVLMKFLSIAGIHYGSMVLKILFKFRN